jgi:ribosomal protein S20
LYRNAQVKTAVDTAVQQLREKAQQSENEEAIKLALKDIVDDKVCYIFSLQKNIFFTKKI